MKKTKTSRRALVSLPEGVWEVIDEQLKGKIGNGDSEVIRNIALSYLMERGYLLRPKEKPASMDQIAGELDIHDSMITSLVEVLERKGILSQEEWEQNIKKHVALK
jgi:predicted transcriptional regulator